MIVIVGIGQKLRGDDEAGLAAVRCWQDLYASERRSLDVRIELVESPGLGLLNLFAGAEAALLVDGVRSGAKPGTLHLLHETDLSAFLADAGSAHGWGVAETLALGRKIDPDSLPKRVLLIGIEVGDVTLGRELSPDVVRALPEAASLIQKIIADLTGG
jgi:hydrogenase maturation protease